MDTSEKIFITFFIVLIVSLIVLNLVLLFNNKNTSVGGKQTYTCKDGTTFTCYAGTEGCMDNSPMHCPTPVDVVGNCCNKDGTPDGKCTSLTKEKCKDNCKWKVGPCQCHLENGTCLAKACVGGSHLCGINTDPNAPKNSFTQEVCERMLGLNPNLISCDPNYIPKAKLVDPGNSNGGNCQFLCEKSN
jgi:hypothetical protein